jgi:SAM-dependent methyltransferase
MKDNFSKQSDHYFLYRPTYPVELVEYISSLCSEHNCVWDCGTGNGQLANVLSQFFNKVYATDLSKKQIDNAIKKENIFYKVESVEQTFFEDNQFDLITVAQALHWFDFKKFYKEVNRTLKPNGIFATIGYSLIKISQDIDEIINNFYSHIIGKYWDIERKLVDQEYKTIPFPFNEIKIDKSFSIKNIWSLENLEGYLNSWSGVQNFIKDKNYNPVNHVIDEIKKVTNENQQMNIEFPIFMKIGKVLRNYYHTKF